MLHLDRNKFLYIKAILNWLWPTQTPLIHVNQLWSISYLLCSDGIVDIVLLTVATESCFRKSSVSVFSEPLTDCKMAFEQVGLMQYTSLVVRYFFFVNDILHLSILNLFDNLKLLPMGFFCESRSSITNPDFICLI